MKHIQLEATSNAISILARFASSYTGIFGSPTASLALMAASAPELTQVFLTASSQEAYDLSQRDSEQIQSWFCAQQAYGASLLIRQGDTRTFEDGRLANGFTSAEKDNQDTRHGLTYHVLMVEPVLQGTAVFGVTSFVVLPPPEPPSPPSNANEHALLEGLWDLESQSGDELSIDESFLARSTSNTMLSTYLNNEPNGMHHTNKMREPFHMGLLRSRLPASGNGELDGDEVYLRTKDLASIGAFSGDWVSLPAPEIQSGS